MPPQFLGNPYEREDEWWDSDLDLTRDDEEWITLPNVLTEGRTGLDLNATRDLDILTDEDDWMDDLDDDGSDTEYHPSDEYDPDNENYEVEQEIEDIIHEVDVLHGSSSNAFIVDEDESDYDDDDIDFVTYPLGASTPEVRGIRASTPVMGTLVRASTPELPVIRASTPVIGTKISEELVQAHFNDLLTDTDTD